MSTGDVQKQQYKGPSTQPLPQTPRSPNALYALNQPQQTQQTSGGYGPGNPSPDLLSRYREVYNRPGVNGDANKAALLWDSKGQSTDWAGQNAYGNFLQQVGREPTLQELSQLVPIYQGSYSQGNSAVASLAQLEQQKPQNLQKQAGQYSDQVNGVFQSQLGRQATPDELNHFGGLFASGNLDAYQMQDFLKGTPEYQNQQDTQFRSGLDTQLQNSDLNFFDKAKQGVISQFMQNGTGQSSALDSALTDLMGQISNNRSQYLAQLSASQYGGNKDLALSNYGNTQNQFLNSQNNQRQMSLNNLYGAQGQAQQMGDYNQQMRDMMQSMQGRNTLHMGDYINLGLNAANAGAKAYSGYAYMNGGH